MKGGYDGLTCSVRGVAHEERDRPCQDYSCFEAEDGFAAVAAADGHGGDKYARSHVGASFAARAAVKLVMTFLRRYKDELRRNPERHLAHLESQVVMAWRYNIQAHFDKHPLTEAEKAQLRNCGAADDGFSATLYGTTLLYGALTDDCAFVSQIGDGRCVALDAEGNPIFPVPEDERLGFSVTTSLCGSGAAEDFRRRFVADPPWQAIILCTDGVADSYDAAGLGRFAATLVEGHIADPEGTEGQLREWLPELSRRGSRDDMTVACIHRRPSRARDGERPGILQKIGAVMRTPISMSALFQVSQKSREENAHEREGTAEGEGHP